MKVLFIFFEKKLKHDKSHILRKPSQLPLNYNYQARYERYLLTTITKYFSGYYFLYSIYCFSKKRAVR